MTQVHALMVTKNEEHRYLFNCLDWNQQWWDTLYVYDDRSDDDTFSQATIYATCSDQRTESRPSFVEHEGEFRQDAWRLFENDIAPAAGDWVFALDADEFLVQNERRETSLYDDVRELIEVAKTAGKHSIKIAIPEVWGVESGYPMIRTDDSWAGNAPVRMCEFRYGQDFRRNKKMGSGSLPVYAYEQPLTPGIVSLLHFGYMKDEDKQAKYERYLGKPGHGKSHIRSIMSQRPTLEAWKGGMPRWKPNPLASL